MRVASVISMIVIGLPTSPEFSNPRVSYAPTFIITGVVMVFLVAVVYGLLPEKEVEHNDAA